MHKPTGAQGVHKRWQLKNSARTETPRPSRTTNGLWSLAMARRHGRYWMIGRLNHQVQAVYDELNAGERSDAFAVDVPVCCPFRALMVGSMAVLYQLYFWFAKPVALSHQKRFILTAVYQGSDTLGPRDYIPPIRAGVMTLNQKWRWSR